MRVFKISDPSRDVNFEKVSQRFFGKPSGINLSLRQFWQSNEVCRTGGRPDDWPELVAGDWISSWHALDEKNF